MKIYPFIYSKLSSPTLKKINMKNNLIFFQPITQYVNTGDLIICRSLIEHIRPHGKLIINDRDIPQWFLIELGVQESERLSSLSKQSFFSYLLYCSLLSFMKKNRRVYLFLTPGHLLAINRKADLKNLITAPIFGVVKLAGCRLVKVGASLGPLSSALGRSESLRARFMKDYFVRDRYSLNLARKFGLKKAKFFPDLSWTFNINVKRNELMKFEDRDILFISFRTKTYSKAPETNYSERVIEALEKVLVSLNDNHAFSKILVGYQVGYDEKFCLQIFEHFHSKYPIEFMDERITVNSARDIYEKTKYVISNRLHVLLYGARFEALPIPLINSAVHVKIIGVLEECNLESLVIDINLQEDSIKKKLSAIIKNQNETIQSIGKIEERYKDQSRELITNIFN